MGIIRRALLTTLSHGEEEFLPLFASVGTVILTQGVEIFLNCNANNIIINYNQLTWQDGVLDLLSATEN